MCVIEFHILKEVTGMKIQRYNSNGRYHEAVVHNGTLYLSGQVAPDGGTVTEQARGCLENLGKTLAKYGSDKSLILSATVYLADMGSFAEFNAVWDAWFEAGTQPVRTCVGAQLAGAGYALEITLIAAIRE